MASSAGFFFGMNVGYSLSSSEMIRTEYMTVQVTESNFLAEVSAYRKLSVVLFTTEWCGSAVLLMPVLEKIEKKYREIGFFWIDMDQNRGIAEKFGVHENPTLLIFSAGEIVDTISGTFTASELERKFGFLMNHQLNIDII